jgi:VIT1/CCC1 family predicted Fe2+/Mn2+ transporter
MKGFTDDQAKQLTEIYSKNEKYWLEIMMRYELDMADTENEKPHLNAFAMFLSFVIFGFLPLIPYLFETRVTQAFSYSAGFAIGALVLLGALRWMVTRQNIVRTIGESVLLGVVSGSVAYIVGLFFS